MKKYNKKFNTPKYIFGGIEGKLQITTDTCSVSTLLGWGGGAKYNLITCENRAMRVTSLQAPRHQVRQSVLKIGQRLTEEKTDLLA